MSYKTTGGAAMQCSYSGRPTLISLSVWVKKTAATPATAGMLMESNPSWHLYLPDDVPGATHSRLQASANWSGGNVADETPGGFDMSAWTHLFADYNGSSTANRWRIYRDNVLETVTAAANPSGTLDQAPAPWWLFNRNDYARAWIGHIAHAAIFDRILSDTQRGHLAAGRNPMNAALVGSNPVWYNCMKTGVGEVSGFFNAQVGTLANDVSGFAATLDAADNPTVDDPPAGPVLVKRWRIPTTASDGAPGKLFIWTTSAYTTPVVTNVSVVASGGFFKHDDSTLTVGQKLPAAVILHGASDAVDAPGGPAWAEAIEE